MSNCGNGRFIYKKVRISLGREREGERRDRRSEIINPICYTIIITFNNYYVFVTNEVLLYQLFNYHRRSTLLYY